MRSRVGSRAPFVEHVDHRGALGWADGDARLLSRPARRRHPELRELAEEVDGPGDRRLRVISHHDHRVLGEEALEPAAGLHHARQVRIGLGERAHLGVGAVLVRVPVVVRQREQEHVEEVPLHEVGADARRVPVADPRHPQHRAAGGLAAREDVGVEELARPEHGVAHDRRREPREQTVAARLVAMAAAVDEIGGAGRAHAGVVEALEDRRHLAREVGLVEVVDRVRQLARDPEPLRRAQARPVLHVATLLALVPVHPGDAVAVLPGSRDDRPCAHRRDRGEGRHALLARSVRDRSARRGSAWPPGRVRDRGRQEPLHRSHIGRAWAGCSWLPALPWQGP